MSDDISRWVWETRYRHKDEGSITDSWKRVAQALASVESDPERYTRRFLAILDDFRFLPGGRILAGAGTGRDVTLFNCFAMGLIEDSLDGIFTALRESALTMQMGGGIGLDFSTLRPAGVRTKRVGVIASGPVSFMHVWDAMCASLVSSGNRRGAMMATLRCDHPDIASFITAKQQPGVLTHFNLSVQVTDAFMRAVESDGEWALLFPADSLGEEAGDLPVAQSPWPGRKEPVACRVVRTIRARELWEKITQAAYDTAEPGVLFVDQINRENNLAWRERISATNPCGEIPLPPWGGCDLGSINLTRFINDPFGEEAAMDWKRLEQTVHDAVRLLDNAIDLSHYPLPQQREQMQSTRRIGLGITGLADALMMLNIRYGEEASFSLASHLMQAIRDAAYRASIALAREKGAFPAFDASACLASPFIERLPEDIREDIARYGIRNSHLLAIAPAGTISLLAGNISSGLEPVFEKRYRRRVRIDGEWRQFDVEDYGCKLWRERGMQGEPPAWIGARELSPDLHLQMQASLQPFVDSAISKTVNIPASMPYEEYRGLYEKAWHLGLKGCTTYRPNPITGSVLDSADGGCCRIDREGG
ncbi:MAG: adenosylcobalamin-dependent ribonucleoside-diphosphate reductase [Sedimenticolaceae bacterium]|nr:adenosylcobalamin-dependent ribonucleoside-diphosphate reductase [Sedimenticolaceae bacterium]